MRAEAGHPAHSDSQTLSGQVDGEWLTLVLGERDPVSEPHLSHIPMKMAGLSSSVLFTSVMGGHAGPERTPHFPSSTI